MLGDYCMEEKSWAKWRYNVLNGVNTYAPRKSLNTSTTAGREYGSSCQQLFINVHNSSVQVGCVGRGGWAPFITSNIAAVFGLSLKGTAPVNTWVDVNRDQHTRNHSLRTSTITMAKEKISDSLLCVPIFKTSGAAHRGVKLLS